MSDELPPPTNANVPPADPVEPNPVRIEPDNLSSRRASWLATGIGALLCLITTGLCILFPPLFLMGFLGAFVCLFVKGYRAVFLGYALCLGLILLGLIIYCSTQPFDMK